MHQTKGGEEMRIDYERRLFLLANSVLALQTPRGAWIEGCMANFEMERKVSPSMTITVEFCERLPKLPGEVVTWEEDFFVSNYRDLECRYFVTKPQRGPALLCETGLSDATLFLQPETFESLCKTEQLWRYLALERLLGCDRTLVMRGSHLVCRHHSLVVLHNEQSECGYYIRRLAQELQGEVVNEDYFLLTKERSGWMAHGTPMKEWAGGRSRNRAAPLTMILGLNFSYSKNLLGAVRMGETRKARRLQESILWDSWNSGFVRALAPMSRAVGQEVPCYSLYLDENGEGFLELADEVNRLL